jgi:hypothetical protein
MSCQKATENLEKSKFEKLSFIEATSLKLHFAMCKECKDYQKYSAQLDEILKNEFGKEEIEESKLKNSLSADEKEALIEKLKNHI